MRLKFEIDSVEDLEESVKSLYVEKNGKFVLDVEGVPEPVDTSTLEETLRKERELRKQFESKEKERERQLDEERRKQLEKDEQFKTLWEEEQRRRDEDRAQLENLRSEIRTGAIDAEAQKLALELSKKDAQKAALLKNMIKDHLEFQDGRPVLKNQLSKGQLAELMTANYPFLVDGPSSTGGRSKGDDARSNTNVKTITRAEFDTMPQEARAKFFKDGGSISNT